MDASLCRAGRAETQGPHESRRQWHLFTSGVCSGDWRSEREGAWRQIGNTLAMDQEYGQNEFELRALLVSSGESISLHQKVKPFQHSGRKV